MIYRCNFWAPQVAMWISCFAEWNWPAAKIFQDIPNKDAGTCCSFWGFLKKRGSNGSDNWNPWVLWGDHGKPPGTIATLGHPKTSHTYLLNGSTWWDSPGQTSSLGVLFESTHMSHIFSYKYLPLRSDLEPPPVGFNIAHHAANVFIPVATAWNTRQFCQFLHSKLMVPLCEF